MDPTSKKYTEMYETLKFSETELTKIVTFYANGK